MHECLISDSLDPSGNGDIVEARTIIECLVWNGRQLIREGDRGQF